MRTQLAAELNRMAAALNERFATRFYVNESVDLEGVSCYEIINDDIQESVFCYSYADAVGEMTRWVIDRAVCYVEGTLY